MRGCFSSSSVRLSLTSVRSREAERGCIKKRLNCMGLERGNLFAWDYGARDNASQLFVSPQNYPSSTGKKSDNLPQVFSFIFGFSLSRNKGAVIAGSFVAIMCHFWLVIETTVFFASASTFVNRPLTSCQCVFLWICTLYLSWLQTWYASKTENQTIIGTYPSDGV